jgi:uncharacterized coiled-coil protein SlyX
METDILSQKNRDNIRDLTKRMRDLEEIPEQAANLQEINQQILKIWDSMSMIATSLAELKKNLKYLEKFFSTQQDQLNKLMKKPKVKKKKHKKAA